MRRNLAEEFLPAFRRSTAPDSARTKGGLGGAPRRSLPERLGRAVASPTESHLSLARILRYSRLQGWRNSYRKMGRIPFAGCGIGPSRSRSEKSASRPDERGRLKPSPILFGSCQTPFCFLNLSRRLEKITLVSLTKEMSVGRASAGGGGILPLQEQ